MTQQEIDSLRKCLAAVKQRLGNLEDIVLNIAKQVYDLDDQIMEPGRSWRKIKPKKKRQ